VGQKTHPKGFRLVTTQNHLSNWFNNKLNYSKLLEEDFLIRSKVEKDFKDFLSISKIEINRIAQDNENVEFVNIKIHALFPRIKTIYKKVSTYFNKNSDSKTLLGLNNTKGTLKSFTSLVLKRILRKRIRELQIQTNKNYYISINFIKNPFEDAALTARFIADELEKRTPFRRVIKQTIKKVKNTHIQGVKIQVSGRLNGIEIARTEWKRDGRVPLHTLKAKIDYNYHTAQTIYGVIGIKVWLFSGD
jgi:small subunit ribosomal protein S3